MPWNKLCVNLIVYYVIRQERKKINFNVKVVTMIYPVTGWSEITQYDDKIAITSRT